MSEVAVPEQKTKAKAQEPRLSRKIYIYIRRCPNCGTHDVVDSKPNFDAEVEAVLSAIPGLDDMPIDDIFDLAVGVHQRFKWKLEQLAEKEAVLSKEE